MKLIKNTIALGISIAMAVSASPVYANLGDFGFFTGISEGRKLYKTTEQILEDAKGNTKDEIEGVYKELIFLSGQPEEFEGLITVNTKIPKSGNSKNQNNADSYDVEYTIKANENMNNTNPTTEIDRKIKYEVDFRQEGLQTIKDYKVDSWKETITNSAGTYTLDENQSYSNISVIEHHSPGVTYYRGDVSQRMVYALNDQKVTWEISGPFYGYNCGYSSTETQRFDCTVTTDDWQIQYQIRPSVSVGKTLQYAVNEPTAISFDGNYKEVMQNKSGLSYNIYTMPNQFANTINSTGNLSVDTFNDFEQLIAPNTNFLKGNFAEHDIKKLFAMKILDGDPKYYQPAQAITRGEYVKALVKAIKMPIQDMSTTKKGKNTTVNIVFPDVLPERNEYPYIMAAYDAGLCVGRDNGHFYIDSPLERQEAIVILIRTLGLENLGLDPTPVTSFTDDSNIADWAKMEVYAANRIGIISPDDNGAFRPTDYVSKAEAAAFINRLNEYMRTDLQTDYTEHIVNYAN